MSANDPVDTERSKGRKMTPVTVAMTASVVVIVAVLASVFTPLRYLGSSPAGEYQVQVTVDGQQMVATMEDNSSSQAFRQLLRGGPMTVSMRDFGSVEKVGMLWRWLPTNNTQVSAQPGDIILYMGGAVVLYYEPHSWNFTRLGRIEGVMQEELVQLLGSGDVDVTFELISPEA